MGKVRNNEGKRIGIFGGTFDPIHIGHLIMAEQARVAEDLEEIWFVPANIPPHKQGPMVDAKHRLAMVEKAVMDHPFFFVSRVEFNRDGPSYTVDTLISLGDTYPNDEFYLIMGADMVLHLSKWHRVEEILNRVSIIGLLRPGYALDQRQLSSNIKNRLTLVNEGVKVDISSSHLRERLIQGKSVRYLIPDSVRLYLEENHLYGWNES
ncbi:nicotinate-nucleotide adenylyltransferase [Marininema halotolerans]|uniref:Probable nicotinate-nucleotide adenylyltransferase n=1 Tax=Marininema halotolerans TaxID=1155944 RepID=A0A1I6RXZ9_9BACL|nr:nicotinate-nucleotide adenylyltransferase [Marininema halotolerans]SFS69562.1 nicotinate-nucleotide adenylyltransferase [Marininema halotolerans]